MYVMGLVIGHKGASALISDKNGNVCAQAYCEYLNTGIAAEPGRNEQHPKVWWIAACSVIRHCLETFIESGHSKEDIVSIAAAGSSGTVFLGDANGAPVTSAIIFDDKRASVETELLHNVGRDYENKLGMRFNESYGLPKLLWIKKNMPYEYDHSSFIMHPADYILAKLTGCVGYTDYATALKTGYDIIDERFSPFIYELGIEEEKLPKIYAPGSVIESVCEAAAEETGLSSRTLVTAGATDGYASGLCSGTVSPGRWATILGNTFGVKGITENIVKDRFGRIYCHKHPSGYNMPSGMSNTGGKCLEEVFGIENLKKFDASVLGLIPTNILIYPLSGVGENFPFIKKDAKKFILGYGGEKEMYTAHLEGLSYVEKLAFETMEKLGCKIGHDVYAVGGSTKGLAWLKIRATVLNRCLHVPKVTVPSMGSAMLAASNTLYKNLKDASLGMFQEERVITPYYDFVRKYERLYLEFKDKCSAIFSVDL